MNLAFPTSAGVGFEVDGLVTGSFGFGFACSNGFVSLAGLVETGLGLAGSFFSILGLDGFFSTFLVSLILCSSFFESTDLIS